MGLFERQPIGNCWVCSQGWAVIVKEISSQKYFVYCNECEAEWDTPEEFLSRREGSRFKYGVVSEPNDKEVLGIGWDKYINKELKNRI
ncbi:hypothetical protein [Cohnella fermenti]|uniref:Uncharacterized protein n=1 Tax=Cohnella fermenti TaxID=2565925 RepID=A0A4S4BFU6_9BACL|nr:hypothetical protein [Cohnella fermenti]THF72495.1 hypothetical protein E6C55_32960 [Cohnella fermenti]